MPSRILKESICTSESLAQLSAEAEVLFYRLIVRADDFGLFFGSPKLLASLLYPLRVPEESTVAAWLDELIRGGLVATYTGDDGRKYLKLLSWDKHQNKRAVKPKYPQPQSLDAADRAGESTCGHLHADENTRTHLHTIADNCTQMNTNVSVNENVNENVNAHRPAPQNGAGGRVGFRAFWDTYPRKAGKTAAKQAWTELRPSPELARQIIRGVLRWAKSEQWSKEGGRYVPYPSNFLRGKRWEDCDESGPDPGSFDTDEFFAAALKNSYSSIGLPVPGVDPDKP